MRASQNKIICGRRQSFHTPPGHREIAWQVVGSWAHAVAAAGDHQTQCTTMQQRAGKCKSHSPERWQHSVRIAGDFKWSDSLSTLLNQTKPMISCPVCSGREAEWNMMTIARCRAQWVHAHRGRMPHFNMLAMNTCGCSTCQICNSSKCA